MTNNINIDEKTKNKKKSIFDSSFCWMFPKTIEAEQSEWSQNFVFKCFQVFVKTFLQSTNHYLLIFLGKFQNRELRKNP